MKTFKKAINIVIDVIVIFILLISIMVVILSITSKSSGVSNIFGITPMSVSSNSMEDTINVDDLIFSHVTNDPAHEYHKGDIVSFYIDDIDGDNNADINTHRIVEVIKDDNITYYKTQGDNKNTNPEPDKELQTSSTIIAKFDEGGFKIPKVGAFLRFIRTQLGFFLCILLPMILFFIYEAIRVIMNVIAYNKEKAMESAESAIANSELTEEQKKKAIEEYLAQQKQNKEDEQPVQTPAGSDASDAEQESET